MPGSPDSDCPDSHRPDSHRPDPFRTAQLRAGVLAAWSASPTRFREDANAEEDLRLDGYADAWLVELAQNAADAARAAGRPGRLAVELVGGTVFGGTVFDGTVFDGTVSGGTVSGGELRVANTGAPLDAAGVAALASLRASAKRDDDASVGRFGVGFTAVLALTDAPRLLGTGGGVAFSAARTAREVAALPGPAAELARRDEPPVLRLAWPTDEPPRDGFDTEVRLPLRAGVGGATLLAQARADALDLLLVLPELVEIEVAGELFRRDEHGDGEVTVGHRRWRLARRAGTLDVAQASAQATEQRSRRAWTVCWALPLTSAGDPAPLGSDPMAGDVLHAPTATAERLSLPARLIAPLPLEPDRRRVRLGPAAEVILAAAAPAYLDLVRATPPGQRTALVPPPGFPRSELDDRLRTSLLDALRGAAWLPAAAPGTELAPARAEWLDLPEADPALPALLAAAGFDRLLAPPTSAAAPASPAGDGGLASAGDGAAFAPLAGDAALVSAVDGAVLAPPVGDATLRGGVAPGPSSGGPLASPIGSSPTRPAAADSGLRPPAPGRWAAVLNELGVRRLSPAELVERLLGVDRPASWWREIYAALAPAVDTVPGLATELGALPVPLADGRLVPGPATVLLPAPASESADPVARVAALGLTGLHVAAADAVHPLLARLGAVPAEPAALLEHPALAAAVDRSWDDADAGLDPAPLADAVLALVGELPATPAAGLGALALPDADGEPARADELMLPDAVLRPLLAPDTPVGVLDPSWAARYPRADLIAIGVLDGFALVVDDNPAGPDHDLDDEERWWDGLPEPPRRLLAVRDLDLVDDAAWPAALALLAGDRDTRAACLVPGGHTGWWLARHARLAGRRPSHFRLPSADRLAALFDPVPGVAGVDEAFLAAIGVRADLTVTDARAAADLLDRLADPRRHPDPALAVAAHGALAEAVLAGRVHADDLDPPEQVRALDGSVVGVARAVVLDAPWSAAVLPAGELVCGGDPAALAELLDLPLATEVIAATVEGAGTAVDWTELAEVVLACQQLGVGVPGGRLRRHDQLWVQASRPVSGRFRVPAWLDDDGRWHAEDPLRALLGILAEETS